jgi:PTS system nitrogen regulatory IIA component
MDEPYVPIEELAKHFSVSVSTVRGWIRENTIPTLKIGGVYRFRKSEVEAVFKQRLQPTEVEGGVPTQLNLNFDIDDPNEDI